MSVTEVERALKYGGFEQRWWGLLNEITTVLGSTKAAFWPFFENTGQAIAGLGSATSLVPRDEAAARNLEDEWTPRVLRSSAHYSVKNVAATNNHFSAGDAADYSHGNGTVDTPFSLGIWIAPQAVASAQALLAKYVAATEEWAWRIDSSGNLELELHDADASASEIATSDLDVDANQLHSYMVTYDGDEADPTILFYKDGKHDGGDGTSAETNTYVAMEATATPLLVAASGLTAAPTEEYDGWLAMPLQTGKELTALEVETIYQMQRQLIGA